MPPVMGLQYYNTAFVSMAEHWDNFLMDYTMSNPNIWHDRILRGAFPLFHGTEQKTNIFRGGIGQQSGLNTWSQLGTSNKTTGFDNCAPKTPQRYSVAVETIQYRGYGDAWQSDPLCINDLKFQDYAKEQVALNVRVGVEFGVSMLENFNREQYVLQALQSDRGMIMASGALEFEDNADYRFDYDPFSTVADVDGNQAVYVTYNPTVEISTLNWDFIDYIRYSLSERAADAAIAKIGGMAVFGLMIDVIDFEKMVKADEELRKDWREAKPQTLIDGYSMGVTYFRGMGIMHDPRQMRFRIKGVDAVSGKMVATRVNPRRLGRALTIGQMPEPSPDYFRAELAIGVVFMNDVYMNQFVSSLDTIGSGTTFGPAPGLTGTWKWINIPDPVSNLLGESGFFYGRFQIYPKPLIHANDCTVFLYRRCVSALRTKCAIQSHDDVVAAATAIPTAVAAAAADVDVPNRRVTLTLTGLLAAGLGDPVTVKVGHDSGADVAMRILSDSLAPQYVFGWVNAATNSELIVDQTDFPVTTTTVKVA